MKFFKNKKLGYWFMVATALLSLLLFIIYIATYEPGQFGHDHTMPNSASGQATELVWIWALFALLAQLAALAGIDITTEKPLLDTIEYIGELISEIESLTD